MDYHQFKTYEKVANAAPFPRTRQEQGLFLLELSFSPEDETRSTPVMMTLEFTAFGDVSHATISHCSSYAPRETLRALQAALKNSQPPMCATYAEDTDTLKIQLLENPPRRSKVVPGTLVFNPRGEFVTIAARLRN